MRSKIAMTLWVILALLTVYSPIFAQLKPADREPRWQRPPEEEPNYTEERVLHTLNWLLSNGENPSTANGLCQYLGQIAKYTASFKSQRVAQKLIDLPESWNVNDSTTAPYPITIAKLSILRHFKDYVGVREYVINSLDHQSSQVQIAAASTLLSWDEWELAAPVICRNEAYIEFQMHRDDRAIPLLEEATRNGGWQGRIFAAAALFYTYGDSARYPQVALDIILNAPININDENTNRAKFLALDQVARFNLTQALPGLIRMAQDTARGISAKAVSYLVDLAGMGHSEATQALLDIKENHPNANVRAIARHGLTKLEQEQK